MEGDCKLRKGYRVLSDAQPQRSQIGSIIIIAGLVLSAGCCRSIIEFIRPDINAGSPRSWYAVDIDFGCRSNTASVDCGAALFVSHIAIIRVAEVTLRIIYHDIMVCRIARSGYLDLRVEQIVAYDGVFARRLTVSYAEQNAGEEIPAVRIIRQVVNNDPALAAGNCDSVMVPDEHEIVLDAPVYRRYVEIADALRATDQRTAHGVVPGDDGVAADQSVVDRRSLVPAAMKLDPIVVVSVHLVEVLHSVANERGVVGRADNPVAGNVLDGIALDRDPITANHDTVIDISERVVPNLDPVSYDSNPVADLSVPLLG